MDTPEIYGQSADSDEYAAGKAAQEYVGRWFDARMGDPTVVVWVRSYEEQSFSRWVADVYAAVDGQEVDDLGMSLVDDGHGTAV